MKPVVKRKGNIEEKFDERKVYATCFHACANVHLSKKECEEVCSKVCKDTKKWVKGKTKVTSTQIFKAIIRFMKKYNKEAAFMYETHRDIN